MRKELRKLIAFKLMDLSFAIMPDCNFKTKFALFFQQNNLINTTKCKKN